VLGEGRRGGFAMWRQVRRQLVNGRQDGKENLGKCGDHSFPELKEVFRLTLVRKPRHKGPVARFKVLDRGPPPFFPQAPLLFSEPESWGWVIYIKSAPNVFPHQLLNAGKLPIVLRPGMKMAQLCFLHLDGNPCRPYDKRPGSKYNKSLSPEGSRIWEDS